MNEEKKMKKILFSFCGLFLSLLTIVGIVNALDEAGKIKISKTATKVFSDVSTSNKEYDRKAKVTLTVDANPYNQEVTTNEKLDIVLILDRSGSMSYRPNGEKGKSTPRIESVISASSSFIESIMSSNDKVNLGVVDFATNAKSHNMTTNKETALSYINNLKADGGTNMQEAIMKANELLQKGGRNDAKKIVILLTDGIPTYYTVNGKVYGTGSSDGCYDSRGRYHCASSGIIPSQAAKNELDSLKNSYKTADVYTITFGKEEEAAAKLQIINPAANTKEHLYENTMSLNADDLNKKFQSISNVAKNEIGKNAVVTDIIPNTFRLTDESLTDLNNKGINVTTNAKGEQVLTWNIGTINANNLKSLEYTVVAKDEYHGSMFTNTSATLNVTVDENNTYYDNTNLTLEFDKPTVEIPAITNDDSYKNIESYSAKEGNTINGTTILANDLNNTILEEKSSDIMNVKVSDEIVVVENENTKKIDTNKYELYKDGKLYGTLLMNNDGTFKFDSIKGNHGEISFDYYIKSNINQYHETPVVYSNTSTVTLNIIKIERITVSGTKTWNDDNNRDGIRPKSITVNLYADGEKIDSKVVTGDNWTYEFTNLYKEENNKNIVYTINEENVQGYTKKINGYNITNTHEIEKTAVRGTKTWNDDNNRDGIRPDSITVNLYADGVKVDSKELSKGNWNYVFTNLPKNENGKAIKYTISEDEVEGYKTEVNGYNITNTHEIEKTSISGTKTWNDDNNRDGIRPDSIKVKLYADGKEVASKEVSGNWTYEFTNLPVYDNGKEITYTIDEESVRGYTKEINGYNLINTHTISTTAVSGTKTWNDDNNRDGIRPDSITVNLYADGEKIDSKEVSGNWTYEFTNLPVNKNGKAIKYTISEDEVEGYKTEINGYNITNTHEIEKTAVRGTKTWNDDNNRDGIRPDSIKVKLYADGKEVASKEVSGNWAYEFTNLPVYDNGKEITYTIDEESVKGYTKEINGYNLINTHTISTTAVSGTKTWNDDNNRDGIRPDSITVNLYADGEKIDSKEVSGNWAYEFTNLPVNKNGKAIKYTVSEDEVKGYKTGVNGYNITNTHEIEKTAVRGTKTWNDDNNRDGNRPDSITVNLYANGVYKESKEVSGNWAYEFTNLPKNENGKAIIYTITENKVEGYETKINGYNITNTHEIEKTSISGTKIWNDDNNRDGIRPKSIKVTLYANGEKVETKEVSGNWTYEFTNLPVNKNGKKISYTIDEESVQGYTKEINGYNLINTHDIYTTAIRGSKTWDDNNNNDGLRPDSITVNLYADGKYKESKTVTAENGWSYLFTNLPVKENGKEITYTISENPVEGYVGTIKNNNITNKHEDIKVEVKGSKHWVDSNNKDGLRPNSIKVRLYADGKEVSSKEVTQDDNWAYSFNNLNKYKNGKEIAYTISEDAVELYETTYDGYDIINTHNPKDVTVSGTKTWNNGNNRYGHPDTITVNLSGKVGDKEIVKQSLNVSANDNWAYSFTNLPEYSEGKLVNYTISENAVKDYDTEVNGYNLINTYNPETISINGIKTWNDEDNRDGLRPDSITVNLYANGEKIESKEVSGNWAYEFTNLPKFANGVEIKYEVRETDVNGYEQSLDGFNITNTHVSEKISFNVKKAWEDDNNNDGIRPDSITVHLYANGVEIKSATINEENDWTYKFEDLYKYEAGREIEYSIIEDEVKGYVSNYGELTVIDRNTTDVIITNTHENEQVELEINKVWDDFDNAFDTRPDSITVNIYADGVLFESISISELDDWKTIISNLNKYNNGKEITYTIEEEEVELYEAFYDGNTIINVLNNFNNPPVMFMAMNYSYEEMPPQTGIDNKNNISYMLVLMLGIVISIKKVLE